MYLRSFELESKSKVESTVLSKVVRVVVGVYVVTRCIVVVIRG